MLRYHINRRDASSMAPLWKTTNHELGYTSGLTTIMENGILPGLI